LAQLLLFLLLKQLSIIMKKLMFLFILSFTAFGIVAQTAVPDSQTVAPVKKKRFRKKRKKTAVVSKTTEVNPKYRLGLSFISYGSGTDGKIYQKVDSFLKSQPKKLVCVDQPWGREGELDKYFLLKELDGKAQTEFIARLKKLCEGNQMVIISENVENQRQRR
jgi:hypothetical protein